VKLNIVPARTGIQWVKLGVQTFFKQPLALSGLFFMYMAAVLVLSAIPFVGQLAVAVLVPAATLGMMAATEQASHGRFPMPSVLISAFRAGKQRARAMLVLGVIYAVVLQVITLIASLLFAGGPGVEATPATTPGGPPQIQIKAGFLFAMALQLPLVVLFAHAPALVHWHGVSPVKSLFFSSIAFVRNFGAFVTFGAGWLLVLSVMGLALSVLIGLFGAVSTTFMWPLVLLVVTMMATSMYFTFRDSFVATPDEAVPPVPSPGESPP
jgi:hypothetical protein